MVAHSTPPSLQLVGINPQHAIQLRLQGQDTVEYLVEASTNLVSWQPLFSLTTTNGVAEFTHDSAATDYALFFRATQQSAGTNIALGVQVDPFYNVRSVITADGGAAELITPDFRHITLTIPAGCVVEPQMFTMTLVSNISGLPFSQGSFGAVVLQPENLTLSGAASLEIDLPMGIDTCQVASFGINNDGSAFRLVLDQLTTNTIVVPITRFATYGSGLATQTELGKILHPAIVKRGTGSDCEAPDDNPADVSKFPKSCPECFPVLVDRAVSVRTEMRQFEYCTFEKPLIDQVTTARQQQLLGQPDNPSVLVDGLTNICPLYEQKVAPLWTEAAQNCALGVVLLEFMLGFERQIELLGQTNISCSLTLGENLANLCTSAHECLKETLECCREGHKGPEKLAEVESILQQFQLLGYDSCFPNFLDDPDVQAVFSECLTNAWLGYMNVTQTGEYEDTTSAGGVVTTDHQTVNSQFRGQTWISDEFPDGLLYIQCSGGGTLQFHETLTSVTTSHCLDGTSIQDTFTEQVDSLGITNYLGKILTNDVALSYGIYEFNFILNPNQTYQLLALNCTALLDATVNDLQRSQTETCEGGSSEDIQTNLQTETLLFPVFTSTAKVFPMSDSNSITGSFDETLTNSYGDAARPAPVVTKTHFEWTFRRKTQ